MLTNIALPINGYVPNQRLKSKKFIGFWVNEALHNRIKESGFKKGLSVSEYVVSLLISQTTDCRPSPQARPLSGTSQQESAC
jgi:hypothetical protein